MHEELYKKLIITEIKKETDDVTLFYFDDVARTAIPFKAGQYLTFAFEEHGKEARRSYSIAASPVLEEPLSVGIQRISNGNFSRKLFDYAKVGDSLLTTGAGGVFTLPSDIHSYKQLYFFAAGSGIIPIYSLIKTVLFSHPGIEVILIYSNRSLEKTLFYESLRDLKNIFPANLHIEFLFSNTANLLKARLHGELILLFLDEYAIYPLDRSLYYICGPEAYMRLCIITLQALKIPSENIKKEIFHTGKFIHKAEPPDKAAHEVSILVNKHHYRLQVQYPTTILQAAKNQGIVLPYSCEVGKCGNCMATCLRGKVWMSYNEVLTEKELIKGLVLTCTGFPIEDDVTVSFDDQALL
jgi:ferredoxin-NADP reductase